MLYHYSAVDATGKVIEGDYEADTQASALRYLQSKELRPLNVKATGAKQNIASRFFGGSISTTDKVFLTKYLALMLRVGIDLLSAVNILIADFEKPAVRNFLVDVRTNLSQGQPFWKTFAAHPETFSPNFISLVKAAEVSGNLQKTFEELSVSTQREAEIEGRVKAALIYPVILLCMATAILTFLVTFALPKIAGVFAQSGVKPPVFSQIVFAVGLFIGGNIWIILPGAAVIIGGALWAVKKTQAGKRALENFLMATPVIKTVYEQTSLQRMAGTISSLLRAGLPILETIDVAAQTVGHRKFKQALNRIANEGLAKGLTIGEAFRRETVFPQTVSNLVAISEQAGHLDEVLAALAEFYEAEIDASIKTLMSLLEPLLLLVMGVMVAVIALSIIIPVYQLTTQF
jgi:type II secretory pathway component PulF